MWKWTGRNSKMPRRQDYHDLEDEEAVGSALPASRADTQAVHGFTTTTELVSKWAHVKDLDKVIESFSGFFPANVTLDVVLLRSTDSYAARNAFLLECHVGLLVLTPIV